MDPNQQIKQWALEEREFLHSMATPLGTAMLVLDALIESANRDGSESDVKELLLAQKAMEKLKELLQNRRSVLLRKGNSE